MKLKPFVASSAVVFLAACAQITENIKGSTSGITKKVGAPTKKTVDEARERGDYQAVLDICEKDDKASSEVHNYACETAREMEKLAFESDDNCATMVERFRNASLEGADAYAKAGIRLAKCGYSDVIFEEIAHIGDGGVDSIGTQALLKIEDSGISLKEEFSKYIKENSGKSFLDVKYNSYGANHIGHWLEKRGYSDFCAPLSNSLTEASEDVTVSILFYFSNSKCKNALPLAIDLLASNNAEHRVLACNNLAAFGDKKAIPQMEIVAESDSAYEIVDLNKIYYVRDACKAAIGKLKLKGK